MTAFDISMIAEDLRQIKNSIEMVKNSSYEALQVLKRIEDINYDLREVLRKLNEQLISMKALHELQIEKQRYTDGRVKAT